MLRSFIKLCKKNIAVLPFLWIFSCFMTGCGTTTTTNQDTTESIVQDNTIAIVQETTTATIQETTTEKTIETTNDNSENEITNEENSDNQDIDSNVDNEGYDENKISNVSNEDYPSEEYNIDSFKHCTGIEKENGTPETTNYLGTTITTTPISTYRLYSDGSRELSNTKESVTCNTDGYNASDSELKSFAEPYVSSYYSYYETVVTLVNQIRAEVGVSPLVLDRTLCHAATMRSIEMNLKNYFAHKRADDRDTCTVVDYGYSFFGENIAAGQSTPEDVVESWKNSPGHYANMINANYRTIGVGYSNFKTGDYPTYWTQIFMG